MKKAVSQNFLQGAFILILANALVKVIGAIYKLPLNNMIGGEGTGYFSVAYNIYTALFVISTAGVPVAVSKMVAEANALGKVAEVKKIFRVVFTMFFIVGLASAVFLLIFARPFTVLIHNPKSYYSVLAIAPSLFFVAIISTVRGYYQGLSNMVPTAISQIIEALGKLLIGLGLCYYLLKIGQPMEVAVAGSIAGVTIGTVFSALYLVIKRARDPVIVPFRADSLTTRSRGEIVADLWRIALPVTVGASVMSLTNLIDMFVVIGRLVSTGASEEGANYLYGVYNMALTLFNLPQTLIVAISISIIPAIAAACAKRNFPKATQTSEQAMRLAATLALPAAAGLLSLAAPIMHLLYPLKPDEAAAGAPMLAILSLAVVFVAMVSLTNSTLQAVGRVMVPVFTMLAGGVVKLIVNYTLVGTPEVGIHGAPIGTTLCYGTITVLNLIYLVRKTKLGIRIKSVFLRPFVSACAMGLFCFLAHKGLAGMGIPGAISTVVTIFAAIVLYFGLLFAIGGITREDVLLLPKGEKLVRIFKI